MIINFRPHSGQRQALQLFKRFTVLACGRRWGKTAYAKFLLLKYLAEGKRVAYYTPSSKYSEQVWLSITNLLVPLSAKGQIKISAQKKNIDSRVNRACIHFHTLVDKEAGRSQEYDYVIIDEAAFCEHLEYSWKYAIRATLINRKGGALFISSPNGTDNFFHTLAQKKHKDWAYIKMPTWTNPLIDDEELESYKEDMPEKVYLQEIAAEFIDTGDSGYFYEFIEGKHVRPTVINTMYPLWFSWDFNVNPCTVLVGQFIQDSFDNGGGCYIHAEHQLQGNTRGLAKQVWPIYKDHPAGLFVTGDSTGSRTDTLADDLANNYEVIADEWNISPHLFVNTRDRNPLHQFSSNVCNTALFSDITMINPACKELINQLKIAKQDKNGKLIKDRDQFKMDLADAYRYLNNAWFPSGVTDVIPFKKLMYNMAA